MTRILVTGSRSHPYAGLVWKALEEWTVQAINYYPPEFVFVNGDCPDPVELRASVDQVVQRWAKSYDPPFDTEQHPADWHKHGRMAGPLRNKHMASLGASVFLAFPSGASNGTMGCIKECIAKDIPGEIYTVVDGHLEVEFVDNPRMDCW